MWWCHQGWRTCPVGARGLSTGRVWRQPAPLNTVALPWCWLSRMGTPPSPSPCMSTGQGKSHSEIKTSPLHQLNAPGGGLACCRKSVLGVQPGAQDWQWGPGGQDQGVRVGPQAQDEVHPCYQARPGAPLWVWGPPKGRTMCLCSASCAWRSRPSKPGGVCRMVGWDGGGGSGGRRLRCQGPRRVQVFDSSQKPNQKLSSCAVKATEEKWSNGGFPCDAFSVFPKFGGSLSCL